MNGLPQGWCYAELGNLIERIEAGLNVKCEERPPRHGEKGLVKISSVTWGRFDENQSKTLPTGEHVSETVRIRPGDLLFSRANTIELVGATALVEAIDKTLYLSDKVLRLVVPEGSKRWINFVMKTEETRKALQEASSGNQLSMRNISQERLRRVAIPLAPLPEQKRIADKLDSVLARVEACRERLDRIPALLKRFRQSVLAAATSGRLTEDWRKQTNGMGWQTVQVGNICDLVFDGPFGSNLKSDDYVPSGVRVVRLENIAHLAFDASKETYVSEAKYEALAKHTIAPDDVLFSSFVDEEVRVCLFPRDLPTRAINKADCFVLRTNASKCLPTYLCLRLACKTTFLNLKELVHGATRPRINLKQLKQYVLSLPSIEEQHEIVRRVDTLFAFADRLEARYAAARKQVGQLTPALLAKAFRGELVPQDPADEPAAELLKRLAATRSEAPKARRGRKSST